MLRFLVVVLLLGAALAVEAPAWLLAGRIEAATNGLLSIADASGTLWHGNGELYALPVGSSAPRAQGEAAGSSVPLGGVTWRVDRIRPLERMAAITLAQAPGGPRPVAATIGPQGGVATGSVRLPAAFVQRWPPAAGWSAGGTLVAESDALQWGNGQVTGVATVSWRNATLQGPGTREPLALGDVSARVQLGPAGAVATLVNAGGSVRLDGSIDSSSGQVALKVIPLQGAPAEQLAWLASRLGPVPPGGYALRFALPK